MRKKPKIIIAAGVLLLVIAGVIIYLNHYIKNEIKEGLGKEYDSSELSYDDLSINLLAGNAVIRNLRIQEGIFSLQSPEVKLSDFSYRDYLENDNLTIGSIHLIDPEIILNKSDSVSNGKEASEERAERKIRVKKFFVSGGSIKMIENDTASNSIYASLRNITIEEIVIEKMDSGTLLPFKYDRINIKSDSLYYDLNPYHYIQAASLNLENKDLSIEEFSIIPKYSRQKFDQLIPYEKDWIALKVDRVNFRELELKKKEENTFLEIASANIENANLQIYRNKMLKEDTRIKPMYSEMLRDLDFKLRLDSVNISGSFIEYEEHVLVDRPPGKLNFHRVNAQVKNITNIDLEPEDFPQTIVEARALFMGETEISLNLEFDVSNELDQFQVRGRMGSVKANKINSFLVPAMGVEAEGDIESVYYDFYGNRNQANGNMQLSYRNFKVNILKDGEMERKSIMSRLANLIIKNDRMNEDVQQENISVTRDKTKSFWNFLWLCIRDGALSTFF